MAVAPVVVVTGGGNGIGRGCAELFASRGWTCVLIDLDRAGVDVTLAELERTTSPRHWGFGGVDVCNINAMARTFHKIKQVVGPRIAAAINAAGIEGDRAPLVEYAPATFDRVMRVRCIGRFRFDFVAAALWLNILWRRFFGLMLSSDGSLAK